MVVKYTVNPDSSLDSGFVVRVFRIRAGLRGYIYFAIVGFDRIEVPVKSIKYIVRNLHFTHPDFHDLCEVAYSEGIGTSQ